MANLIVTLPTQSIKCPNCDSMCVSWQGAINGPKDCKCSTCEFKWEQFMDGSTGIVRAFNSRCHKCRGNFLARIGETTGICPECSKAKEVATRRDTIACRYCNLEMMVVDTSKDVWCICGNKIHAGGEKFSYPPFDQNGTTDPSTYRANYEEARRRWEWEHGINIPKVELCFG